MQSFKKAIVRILLFAVILALLSAALIVPVFHSEFKYFCDAPLRRSLAGTLDYLFVGASNGYAAFVPPIADEAMDVNSYNLSGGLLTWYGRRILLTKELERNPVKTVVLEISFNSLWREYHDAWGDACLMSRFDSAAERMRFFWINTSVREWDHIYADLLTDGIEFYGAFVKNTFFGKNIPYRNVNYGEKGFHPKPESFEVTPEMLQTGVGSIETGFVQKNLDELYGMIDLCKQKNIEVILTVVPISDYLIYRYGNWDELKGKWQAIADETGCPLFDFNLLKNRYSLLNDAQSFADEVHMSETGAKVFTAEYAEVMNLYGAGEAYADLFYPDYASMRADSPYLS